MRKLLLATVAGLGVSMGLASYADAQSYDSASGDDSSGQSFPTPGQVTVRLNGRVRFYADYAPGTRQSYTNVAGTATGTNTVTNNGTSVSSNIASTGSTASGAGTNKTANYTFLNYARLYPGFDGVTANGLKYGGAIEIREGNTTALNSVGQGVGATGGGLNGSISGSNAARSQLFFRRAYGYFGTNALGTIRVGTTDGPTSLYMTGTFENFNDGGWNGDINGGLPGNVQLVWPFYDVGAEYTTEKIVYLSPQIYGFDAGVSFEPNTGTNNGGAIACANAAISCETLSSTPTEEIQRRRDTGEFLVRYRGTFGAFGVAATAAYITSGKVANDGTGPFRIQSRFKDLSVGDGGLTVTYGGLTVGGHVMGGNTNNTAGLALQQAGQGGEFAWLAGASYTVGPVIFGASYVDVVSGGSYGTGAQIQTNTNPTGQRREQGVAAGATYSVAPGFALFLSYLWDQRKESGYDFISGTSGASTHNKVTAQVFGLGTSFAW